MSGSNKDQLLFKAQRAASCGFQQQRLCPYWGGGAHSKHCGQSRELAPQSTDSPETKRKGTGITQEQQETGQEKHSMDAKSIRGQNERQATAHAREGCKGATTREGADLQQSPNIPPGGRARGRDANRHTQSTTQTGSESPGLSLSRIPKPMDREHV